MFVRQAQPHQLSSHPFTHLTRPLPARKKGDSGQTLACAPILTDDMLVVSQPTHFSMPRSQCAAEAVKKMKREEEKGKERGSVSCKSQPSIGLCTSVASQE